MSYASLLERIIRRPLTVVSFISSVGSSVHHYVAARKLTSPSYHGKLVDIHGFERAALGLGLTESDIVKGNILHTTPLA